MTDNPDEHLSPAERPRNGEPTEAARSETDAGMAKLAKDRKAFIEYLKQGGRSGISADFGSADSLMPRADKNGSDSLSTGPVDTKATNQDTADAARATAKPAGTEMLSAPVIVGSDGKTYLQGYISNVPEVSQGVQDLDDLKALGTGIGSGLQHVAQETLNYLATPGAVDDTLLQIGPALDNAVNYYANTPPEQVLSDAQQALGHAGQALEDTLGHPLKPEQRGEYEGKTMAIFLPLGRIKALTEKELDALGGLQKLEQMAPSELEALGIRKVADYGPQRLTKEALGLDDHVLTLDATKCMKDGALTVNVDWLQTDKQANLYQFLEKIRDMGRAEGAQSLRIEGDIINKKLLNSPALRRFGTVSQEGEKTVININLGG